MDSLLNALVTTLAALLTLVTSGDHRGPWIRSWDGTTLRLEWDGLIYTAPCSSSVRDPGSGATVTYPACELPPAWEREQDRYRGSTWEVGYDGRTLSFRREARAAGGQATWRQEDFVITSAKAIGWGLFPDPLPRVSAGR